MARETSLPVASGPLQENHVSSSDSANRSFCACAWRGGIRSNHCEELFLLRFVRRIAVHAERLRRYGSRETFSLDLAGTRAKLTSCGLGRNPATGERIVIAASKTPTFKAGKALRDAMR